MVLVNASFLTAHGVDEDSLRRAGNLKKLRRSIVLNPFCPSAVKRIDLAHGQDSELARSRWRPSGPMC